jgi:hypothetical protein
MLSAQLLRRLEAIFHEVCTLSECDTQCRRLIYLLRTHFEQVDQDEDGFVNEDDVRAALLAGGADKEMAVCLTRQMALRLLSADDPANEWDCSVFMRSVVVFPTSRSNHRVYSYWLLIVGGGRLEIEQAEVRKSSFVSHGS